MCTALAPLCTILFVFSLMIMVYDLMCPTNTLKVFLKWNQLHFINCAQDIYDI